MRDPNKDRDFNLGSDIPEVTSKLPKHVRPLTLTEPPAEDGLLTKTHPALLRTTGNTPMKRGADAREKGFSPEEAMEAEHGLPEKTQAAMGFKGIGRTPRHLPHVRGSLVQHYARHGFPNQGDYSSTTAAPLSEAVPA